MNQLSEETVAMLVAIHRADVDVAGHSRSINGPTHRFGLALTLALALCALALVVFGVLR